MSKPSKGTVLKIEVLHRRDPFKLVREPGRDMLQIHRYDATKRKVVRNSAKTSEVAAGIRELDRLYALEFGGPCICEACGQIIRDTNGSKDVALVIRDYLASRPLLPGKNGQPGKVRGNITERLNPILRYIETALGGRAVPVNFINDAWAQGFRVWYSAIPYRRREDGPVMARSASTVEACLTQLAAALRFSGETPRWTIVSHVALAKTPRYRADIETLAAMFSYCIQPNVPGKSPERNAWVAKRRSNLLAFLRFSVATWARPEAVLECSTAPESGQWYASERVFDLNPAGRAKTRKRRALVPIPEVVAQWLDSIEPGPVVAGGLNQKTFRAMAVALGLPLNGQSGYKLIRRSVATLARKRIGEANWAQGKIMLGHGSGDVSDLYAIFDPINLGVALGATESIIKDIEAICPGAFIDRAARVAPNVVALNHRVAA